MKDGIGKQLTVSFIVCAGAAFTSCSAYDAITIARSGSIDQGVKAVLRQKGASYAHNPYQLVQDVKRGQQQFRQVVSFLRRQVGGEWGDKEILVPSRTRYVKYTHNYKSRAVVDFDAGTIKVETLNQDEASLRNAIVATLLTPDDPRSVDLYSDKTIKLSGQPYLYGLVVDQHGRSIDRPSRAEAYADFLLPNKRERQIQTPQGPKIARSVEFNMIRDREQKQAQRYALYVERYADEHDVSKSLVYAVIKTESNFNPFAVSVAPAYGLMQLVPASGGREAYRAVNGSDKIPSREYLFDAEKNIELGTAYLGIINHRYLADIQNPTSREYCTIASYNGGAGNVLRLFSADRRRAFELINSMSAPDVYRKLRDEYPRGETRRYLVKVLDARRDFVNI